MKRLTPSNILCVLVLLILFVGGASMFLGEFVPFRSSSSPTPTPVTRLTYTETIQNIRNRLDNSKDYLLGRQHFLELCGCFRRAAYQTQTDDVVLLRNGYLTNIIAPADPAAAQSYADSVISFAQSTEKSGIPFLYIQVPQKVSQYDDQMPPGQVSYINNNFDRHLFLLESGGVSTYDLRDAVQETGIDHYSLYFFTDHHWKMSSGLWAAETIAQELNERYGFALDTSLLQEEDYTHTTLKDWYLGSQGRQVTAGYIAPDDFTYLTPNFETNFRVEHPDKGIDITGDFYQTMYDEEMLLTYDLYGQSTYESILGGNRPLTRITNNSNPDGLKILLIHDSYSTAVMPFLALSCGEIHMIDVRDHAGNYTGNLDAYREETQPDIVIVMLCSPVDIDRSDG